ncbi:acyl-CoA thioesterase [Glaciihabitans sp. INWT7]|uniref:acyl-CoA thioesterase n=1 Tax=Glaciihabitans sp. INWT7 TaxID=2596912 RepID=UPI001626C888|nr:thioesterase family protein [Glaciihabitans sp. INWT7]QNE47239.1 acyl-CoA thioesterase [Glaciihabitans sp. INWT7]
MARLHIPTVLRWGDLDAYGHVNNVEILRLLEEARVQALWMPDDEAERAGTPPSAVLDARLGSPTLSIIARTEIEYLATIDYRRSPLDIQVWIGRLGGADLDVCYEIRSPIGAEPAELYARAATRVVLCDSQTMKPRRLSPKERAAWKPYVEEPPVFTRR